MIADILPAAFVANVHLVATSSTPSNAVQQNIAIAGSTSRFDAHVFGSVVSYDITDFFISRPVDVGRISVLHDDPPFLNWSRHLSRRAAFARDRTGAGPPIDEGACVGGIL